MVRALFDAFPDLRHRSWRASPSPEMDVVVARSDGGIIGVEVTRLHPTGGEDARRWEGTQDAIVNDAASRHESKELPNLEVVVFWSAWVDPTTRRRATIVEDLSDFVAEHTPAEGEVADWDRCDDDAPLLPHAIDRVQIRRLFPHPNHWHSPRSASPAQVSASEIRERIRVKESKLRSHRGSYDERWLVLAFGTEGPSTWGLIGSDLGHTEFACSFDRVFVVRPPNEGIELALQHR